MASVTTVCFIPLNFALVSLALLSLVRSAAVSMSDGHSSSFVESCVLKTAMFCSSELVRFNYFCGIHKVFVLLLQKGSVDVGVGGGWSAIDRF